jgi:hypothetical protein
MAKKKKNDSRAAQDGTKSQLRDAKGVNAVRDARRAKGGAGVVSPPKGGGSASFRKSRRVPE